MLQLILNNDDTFSTARGTRLENVNQNQENCIPWGVGSATF